MALVISVVHADFVCIVYVYGHLVDARPCNHSVLHVHDHIRCVDRGVCFEIPSACAHAPCRFLSPPGATLLSVFETASRAYKNRYTSLWSRPTDAYDVCAFHLQEPVPSRNGHGRPTDHVYRGRGSIHLIQHAVLLSRRAGSFDRSVNCSALPDPRV